MVTQRPSPSSTGQKEDPRGRAAVVTTGESVASRGAGHRRLDGLSRLADDDMLHVIDDVRVPAPTVPYW